MNLDQLIKLADAATPGPWWAGKCEPADGHALAWIGNHFVDCEGGQRNYKEQVDDAAFIAAANPTTVKRMAELLMQCREALDDVDDPLWEVREALAALDEFDKER